MYPLIENGPEIPDEVIKALEEERLVFFCGAGISIYSGLPDFPKLINSINKKINIPIGNPMKKVLCEKKWDEYLNLVERETPTGLLRNLVKDSLTINSSKPLDLHEALLKLSKVKNGYRLVTTNFDRRFLETEILKTSQIHSAPALPVPNQGAWSSVVHLHGLIDDNNSLDNLVLTSADFGNAYLNHTWASKFLIELFRNFTVVFIGYSVNDPVVKYLVDAIAANKSTENHAINMFAFAPFKENKRNEIEELWESKSITPISYRSNDNHIDLHNSIIKLSDMHVRGVFDSNNLIKNNLSNKPITLGLEENQILWAISKVGSKEWAELNPPPPLEWLLNVFENKVEDNQDLIKIQSDINLLLLDKQISYNSKLVPNSHYFAIWLSKYINDPRLIRWVIDRGGKVHSLFAGEINKIFGKIDLNPGLSVIWNYIASPLNFNQTFYSHIDLLDLLPTKCSQLIKINILLELLKPRLKLRNAENSTNLYKIINVIDDDSALNFIKPEIYLGTDQIGFNDYLKEYLDDENILLPLCDYLSQYLKQSIDLLSIFEESLKSYYSSCCTYIDLNQESINFSEANQENYLVYLLIKSFNALILKEPKRALANLVHWQQYDYIIFTRLTLHFLAIHHEKLDVNMFVNKLLETKSEFLLTPNYRNECLYFLEQTGNILDKITLQKIIDTIITSHLPQDMLYPDNSKETNDKINQAEKCRRLYSIKLSGAKLHKKALNFLGDYKEKLEIRTKQVRTIFNLADMKIKQGDFLYDYLNASAKTENKDILDKIMKEVLNETKKTTNFKFLNAYYKKNPTDSMFWGNAFNNITNQSNLNVNQLKNAFDFLKFFYNLNPPLADKEKLINPITQCLIMLIEIIDDLNSKGYWKIWELTWNVASSQQFLTRKVENAFNDAFNYPAGMLAKIILSYLAKLQLKFQEGIPESILKPINLIMHSKDSSALYGQVMLASNLNYFYNIDMNWTKENLLPKFKVDKNFDISFWYAYLFQPYISPNLFIELRNDLIGCLKIQDKFDNQSYYSLVNLFITCYLNYNELLDDAYIKEFALTLDETGLNSLACILKDRLYNAGDNAAELWEKSLSKAFQKLWSHQKKLQEPSEFKSGSKQSKEKIEAPNKLKSKTMDTLIHMVLETKDAIPSATEIVIPFIFRTRYIDNTLILLIKNHKYGLRYPESIIKLLAAYIDKKNETPLYKFDEFLDQIENLWPDANKSAYFRYLRSLKN